MRIRQLWAGGWIDWSSFNLINGNWSGSLMKASSTSCRGLRTVFLYLFMSKLDVSRYSSFKELPLHEYHALNFSVYVLDFNWNYLYVNNFVLNKLELEDDSLTGVNMWERFPALAADPYFMLMRTKMQKNVPVNIVTTSPLNAKRLNIVGQSLSDCYFFSAPVSSYHA